MWPFEKKRTHPASARAEIYQGFFRSVPSIVHPFNAVEPHVDVYQFPPAGDGRDFHTLVTSGMSDAPMKVPASRKHVPRRAELLLYTPELHIDAVQFLRFVAAFPTLSGSYFEAGSTIALPENWMQTKGSPHIAAFIGFPRDDDVRLESEMVIESERVALYMPMLISAAERDLVVAKGPLALLDAIEASGSNFEFGPLRPSSV